jgi:hypothetical protein
MSLFSKNRTPTPLVYPNVKPGPTCKNVLFIDSSVKDDNVFKNSANPQTFPIIYSFNSSKSDILTLLEANFTSIDRIAFVFTSTLQYTKTFVDRKPFFTNNESSSAPYSDNVEWLISVIKKFQVKNVDFLACNTLKYSIWTNYYSILTKETGVVVGASNDTTGNLKYGGNWTMENTQQNVELTYFTKSIEYYPYLLDNLDWASGMTSPEFLTVYGDYMYVSNYFDGTISKIRFSDPTDISYNWFSSEFSPGGLAAQGDYLYAADHYGGNIYQILLSDPTVVNSIWQTGLSGPLGLLINSDYLYACNYFDGTITRATLTTPPTDASNIIQPWATGLFGPADMVIYNGYMYVTNNGNEGAGSTVSQIQMSDPSIVNFSWVDGLFAPTGLAIYGSTMYVATFVYGSISQIQITTGSGTITNIAWKSDLPGPVGMTVIGDYLYVAIEGGGSVAQFDLISPPPANICFPARTPIQTDQGAVMIEKINPDIHTINGKKIVDITKTVSPDKYLVCFNKDAIAKGYPSQRTVMSKEHKIYCRGQQIEAKKFIPHFEGVNKIKYNGEPLYNVLMEQPDKMKVNNLTCETLDPNNIIAKLYTKNCKYPPKIKNQIIALLDRCIERRDTESFKNIVRKV